MFHSLWCLAAQRKGMVIRMEIVLEVENVSIRYITGDFKDIGLKEYAMRKLTKNYQVKEFMAVDEIKAIC